jgi:predicted 3-demethylubiquinone-9 3-methyltransferase (glyoxalase superfamily)
MSQKIVPNLWCSGAQEAVDFYTSIFPDSRILSKSYYPMTEAEGLADFQLDFAGKELTIEFELANYHFTAINAGPDFTFNPSVSFMLTFHPKEDRNTAERLEELWAKLSEDGEILMPLDTYDFSDKYGWVKDKYGLTWQLILGKPEDEKRPFIMPALMFGSKENANHAEAAMNYYVEIFKNSGVGLVAKYTEKTGIAEPGSIMYADFILENQWFVAMDSMEPQDFSFNEAVSFAVMCKDQAEIDYFWEKLSKVPEAEQCGWCKDQYGLSWQIVPENVEEIMTKPGAFAKMMQMKKIELERF